MVFTWGRLSQTAITMVRPMTPAPTSVTALVSAGAVCLAKTPATAEVRMAVIRVPSRMQKGSTVSGSLRTVMSMP